jgi:hypothetical protein
MGIDVIGAGGFFYRPFSFYQFTGVPLDVVGVPPLSFSGWQQITPDTGPAAGRWANFILYDAFSAGGVANPFVVQLGLGAAGFEVNWMPSAGAGLTGFLADERNGVYDPVTFITRNDKWSYTFPISIPPHQRISGRLLSFGIHMTIMCVFAFWG